MGKMTWEANTRARIRTGLILMALTPCRNISREPKLYIVNLIHKYSRECIYIEKPSITSLHASSMWDQSLTYTNNIILIFLTLSTRQTTCSIGK